MRATAEVLDGNRVKLSVEVPEDELQEAVEQTLRRLVREARVPGFRPGKVPRRLLEQRLGKKAIRDEVIREVLPDYYDKAVEENELDTITQPEIDITSGKEDGPLAFDAVVEVRPRVSVAGYQGLVVTVPSPEATEEEVDVQIDRLRDQFAQLTDVDRPAVDGDHLTLGVRGTRDGAPVEGLSADDLVYPLGSDGLLEGADEELRGKKAGDIVQVTAEDAPGGPAKVEIIVKQVREKVLPDPDDEWAGEASEFDTVDELRADLRGRISSNKRFQAEMALRERSIDALLELVGDEPPETLVNEELERRIRALGERLGRRKVSLLEYLEAVGQNEETFVAEQRQQAAVAVRGDLALRALADAEEIEVDDDELDAELARLAEQGTASVQEIRRRLETSGRMAELRSELRKSKAVTWLVEHVGVVDDQGNPMDRSALLEEPEAPKTADQPAPTGTLRGEDLAGADAGRASQSAEEA